MFLSVKLPERPTLLPHLWLHFALHSSKSTKSWGHCFTLHLSLPKVGQWRLYISALKNKVSRTVYPRRLRSLFQELCFFKITCFNKKVPRKGSRSEVREHPGPLGAASPSRSFRVQVLEQAFGLAVSLPPLGGWVWAALTRSHFKQSSPGRVRREGQRVNTALRGMAL